MVLIVGRGPSLIKGELHIQYKYIYKVSVPVRYLSAQDAVHHDNDKAFQ